MGTLLNRDSREAEDAQSSSLPNANRMSKSDRLSSLRSQVVSTMVDLYESRVLSMDRETLEKEFLQAADKDIAKIRQIADLYVNNTILGHSIINVECESAIGSTAMKKASHIGRMDICHILLTVFKCDINNRGSHYNGFNIVHGCPLYLVSKYERILGMKYLLLYNNVNVNKLTSLWHFPSVLAIIRRENKELLKILFNCDQFIDYNVFEAETFVHKTKYLIHLIESTLIKLESNGNVDTVTTMTTTTKTKIQSKTNTNTSNNNSNMNDMDEFLELQQKLKQFYLEYNQMHIQLKNRLNFMEHLKELWSNELLVKLVNELQDILDSGNDFRHDQVTQIVRTDGNVINTAVSLIVDKNKRKNLGIKFKAFEIDNLVQLFGDTRITSIDRLQTSKQLTPIATAKSKLINDKFNKIDVSHVQLPNNVTVVQNDDNEDKDAKDDVSENDHEVFSKQDALNMHYMFDIDKYGPFFLNFKDFSLRFIKTLSTRTTQKSKNNRKNDSDEHDNSFIRNNLKKSNSSRFTLFNKLKNSNFNSNSNSKISGYGTFDNIDYNCSNYTIDNDTKGKDVKYFLQKQLAKMNQILDSERVRFCALNDEKRLKTVLIPARLEKGQQEVLRSAAWHGTKTDCIKILLDNQFNPNIQSPSSGDTSLHRILTGWSKQGESKFDKTNILLMYGADPFVKNKYKEAPIENTNKLGIDKKIAPNLRRAMQDWTEKKKFIDL